MGSGGVNKRYYELEIEIKTYFGSARYTIGVWARSKSDALTTGEALAKRKYNKVLSVKVK